ncbi:MAG: hypothetical protein NZ455_00760 [Bacteroidia bacterium]|nr:hypothetical protein [Bacteroidia bacterium]MDW8346838.1 hypothetical protein [Bacteroidia bacterium]
MRRASRQAWCKAPRPHLYPCPGGAAPLARSTPTRSAARDTPKKR